MFDANLRPEFDLAGDCPTSLSYLQIRGRMNRLVDRYCAVDLLSNRLEDLPSQFTAPHQRPWEPIQWQAIHAGQIVGVDPALFLRLLASATEIEAPIRDYAKESWDYLQQLHPQMASFMGGEFADDGSRLAIGIWEKEERQHAPLFGKLYRKLSGSRLVPVPNTVAGYCATGDAWADLRHHMLSRIATEWSAVSVYIWLMAHSTGALQQAIAQPLQDEIGHLAKFWGFSRWALGDSYRQQVQGSGGYLLGLLRHHKGERSGAEDILRLNSETLASGVELTFALTRVAVRLRTWNQELSVSYLRHLLGAVALPEVSRAA